MNNARWGVMGTEAGEARGARMWGLGSMRAFDQGKAVIRKISPVIWGM